MENEKTSDNQKSLPLYEWDRMVVHPADSHSAACFLADRMCIGAGYAESRYIAPYIANDLLEW